MAKRIAFVFLKEPAIEPLGPMYLGAAARKVGAEVKFATHDDPSLIDFAPDYVCYSIMTGDQGRFFEVNKCLKTILKPFKSIIGGPHATFFPEDCQWADLICMGEGERWIMELLSGREIPWGNNLDFYPWPLRPFYTTVGHFITSRGCPYSCTYCYNNFWRQITGLPRIRIRSARDVVDEIDFVKSKFVYFQDDCFGINMNWLREFAQQYSKTPYHCHVRTEMITPERVVLLKRSGCRSVHMAVECADEKYRRFVLDRQMSNTKILEAAELLHEGGIQVMTQNILGLPERSIAEDLATLEMNIKISPAYAWCSIYQPYPGTVLGEYCRQTKLWDGNISGISNNFFSTSCLNIDHSDRESLEVLQKLFAYFVEHRIMPDVTDLTYKNCLKYIYEAERFSGDNKLFGEEIVKSWK